MKSCFIGIGFQSGMAKVLKTDLTKMAAQKYKES